LTKKIKKFFFSQKCINFAKKTMKTDDKKTIAIRLSKETHKKVKQYAIDQESSMQDIAVSLIEELLGIKNSKKQK